MAGYWLKLYTEIIEDPKYHRLSDQAKLGMIELMVLAKKYDKDGDLPCLDDICFHTRREKEWWIPVIEELQGITYLVVNGSCERIRKFAERQAPVDATERQRMYRDKLQKHEYSVNNPVTEVSRNVTESRVDTDTERERDTDKSRVEASQRSLDPALQAVFDLTGFTILPAGDKKDAEYALDDLYKKHASGLKEYLKPFWDEFQKRGYNKTRMFWLTDWAVAGEVPKQMRKNGKAGVMKRYKDPDGNYVEEWVTA